MKNFIIIYFLSFFLFSCQNNNKPLSEIQLMLNKTFLGTEELEKELSELRKESDFIIIPYIDSVDCTPCKLNDLAIYKLYERKLKEEFATDIFLIINHSDKEEIEMLMESASLDFPYLLDKKGEIKETNQISEKVAYQTFILNKENQIIWIGSPVYNENSWELYEEFMKETKLKR